MRAALVAATLLAAACGGGTRTSDRNRDAGVDDTDDLTMDDVVHDLAGLASATVDLAKPKTKTPCPCELGSYCDFATNLCAPGCLGNDHCQPNEICDTKLFVCRPTCNKNEDCAGHRECEHLYQTGPRVCKDCLYQYDDCNGDPTDGCEAKLDSNVNCGKCGQAAVQTCVIDDDNDGFGVKGTDMIQCVCPSGYKQKHWGDYDCDDDNPNVNPGQHEPQESSEHGGDFNCDGKAEPANVLPTTCNANCDDDAIWFAAVPACGEPGAVAFCLVDVIDGLCYKHKFIDIVQACL